MRTIPANLTPELQAALTQSTYLIWLQTTDANPQDWYMSSAGEVVWDGQTWSGYGLRVRHPISTNAMSFSMPNQTGAVLADASLGKFRRAPVKVWVLYPGAAEDGAILFMRGVVSRVSNLFDDRAIFNIERYADENRFVPTTFIAAPGWTKLPPRNLELQWGNRKVALFRPEAET